MKKESIEDKILKYSSRGMNVLREYLPENFCRDAAQEILSWKKGTVVVATGFYVAGHAETDGPAGAYALVLALRKLGFDPLIVTDEFCRDFFEPEGIKVRYLNFDASEDECAAFLREIDPVGMISIERCGKNIEGKYANMRGIDIGKARR